MKQKRATLKADLLLVVRVIVPKELLPQIFPGGLEKAIHAWEEANHISPMKIFINTDKLYIAGFKPEEAPHFIAWLKEQGIEEV